MNEMWQMKQVASFFSSLVYVVYFESLIKKKSSKEFEWTKLSLFNKR